MHCLQVKHAESGGLEPLLGVDYDVQLKCDGRVQAQRRVDGAQKQHVLQISKLHPGIHTFQTRVRAVDDHKWSPWSVLLPVTVDENAVTSNAHLPVSQENSRSSLGTAAAADGDVLPMKTIVLDSPIAGAPSNVIVMHGGRDAPHQSRCTQGVSGLNSSGSASVHHLDTEAHKPNTMHDPALAVFSESARTRAQVLAREEDEMQQVPFGVIVSPRAKVRWKYSLRARLTACARVYVGAHPA